LFTFLKRCEKDTKNKREEACADRHLTTRQLKWPRTLKIHLDVRQWPR